MRYPQGDLAILSAELYDDSPPLGPAKRGAPARKKQPLASSFNGSEEGPRKRARAQAAEASEHDDEAKRARGRPRLDTKDETAADRRRTQIRLAQRAYRNRKENAIQTLERKVQDLKGTNEEMSNAFMQLHDFALSSGLLDQMPEFGRQLQETTEKFLSLAREASDDDAKDGEPKASASGSQTGKNPGSDRARSDSPGQPDSAEQTAATTSPEPPSNTKEAPAGWAGLMVSYEPVTQADFIAPSTLTHPQHQSLITLPSHHQQRQQPPFTYEILTHPTPENASFPFHPTIPGLPGGGLPPFEDLTPPGPLLVPSLPAPDTYAHLEATFGRRLHRHALEQALILLTMPDPPQRLISRVFGFCLLLESPQTILRRVQRLLGREPQLSLFNWQFPFFHLGGAGTHFDGVSTGTGNNTTSDGAGGGQKETPTMPPMMGNQGTQDVLKPSSTAGFATGPFSAAVNAVRDARLDTDMRMVLPGFAGEYFDCDEAEMYLYQRGVVIPPGSDVVTVDVDVAQLESYRVSGWRVETVDTLSGGSSPSSAGVMSPGSSSGGSSGGGFPNLGGGDGQEGVTDGSAWAMADGAGMVDPALADVFSQGNPFVPATTMAESQAAGSGEDMLSFGGFMADGTGNSGYGMNSASQNPTRQRVTVDVMQLVKQLTPRATCLGRSPGFKQADIDAAFWAAVKAAMA